MLKSAKKSSFDLYKIATWTAYFSTLSILLAWALDFYMDGFAALLLSLAALVFYYWGSSLLKAGFLFFVGFSVLFQNHLVLNYSYPFAKIGREIMVIMSETTGLEFQTYLQIITPEEYSNFFCLLFICFLIYKFSPRQHCQKLPVLLGVFVLLFAVWNDLGAPVAAYQKEMSANARLLQDYHNFSFDAQDVSSEEYSTRIIVIGETHRHNYMEAYGYSEEYTPRLLKAREEGKLYYFTDVTSGFYYTTGSVPIILTRKPIARETRFYEEKSIVTAFKEAGYQTWTISYTKKTQPEDDAMNLIFLEADEYINHQEISGTVDDLGMLPLIEEILADKSRKKKFILIKMIGAHYLYEDRYPKEWDIYQPSYKGKLEKGADSESRELLQNSYKNALLYSLTFVDQLAGLVYELEEPALMSFISDHGTCLYEDGYSKFVGRAKGAYHIPFFLTANDAYWQRADSFTKEKLLARRDIPLTQEYFFETYLSLAGLTYFESRPEYDLTSNDFYPARKRLVWTQTGLEPYDGLAEELSLNKGQQELQRSGQDETANTASLSLPGY